MSAELLESSLQTALVGAIPVLLAATGELISEKAGVLNVGLEGCMLMGALGGFLVGHNADSFLLGMAAGLGVGVLTALVFAVVVVVLGGEMILAGLGITFGAVGLSSVLGADYVQVPAGVAVPEIDVPGLSGLPVVGPALFSQPVMVYVALACPFVVAYVLSSSRIGLTLRTVGENPETADALGINVVAVRVAAVAACGALAGLGGAFLSLGLVGTWLGNITNGQGWIAFAIVVFAAWRPRIVIVGALLFGGLATLGNVGQTLGWSVPSQLFSALPYLGTVLVLVVSVLLRRGSGGWQTPWPSALGRVFIRGG